MKRRWTALAGMLALLLLAGALAHVAGSSPGKSADGFLAESTADPMAESTEGSLTGSSAGSTGGLTVHYLDVGKCNCVLVKSADGRFMMIDAGSNGEDETREILEYLEDQGVETLDYLLITHPHKDHIRAAEAVLETFPAETVLMGDFEEETVGTKTFSGFLDFLEKSGQRVSVPEPGDVYPLGEGASFTILVQDDSAETAEEELNDCSTGLILEDEYQRFLFYGDGKEKAEEALQNSGYDLKSDVMMVAHHGGKGSTKKKMLEAVNPRIAVISCGLDDEGEMREPSDKVLERLEEAGVSVYRTDRDGTVVISGGSDGLTVRTKEQSARPGR